MRRSIPSLGRVDMRHAIARSRREHPVVYSGLFVAAGERDAQTTRHATSAATSDGGQKSHPEEGAQAHCGRHGARQGHGVARRVAHGDHIDRTEQDPGPRVSARRAHGPCLVRRGGLPRVEWGAAIGRRGPAHGGAPGLLDRPRRHTTLHACGLQCGHDRRTAPRRRGGRRAGLRLTARRRRHHRSVLSVPGRWTRAGRRMGVVRRRGTSARRPAHGRRQGTTRIRTPVPYTGPTGSPTAADGARAGARRGPHPIHPRRRAGAR